MEMISIVKENLVSSSPQLRYVLINYCFLFSLFIFGLHQRPFFRSGIFYIFLDQRVTGNFDCTNLPEEFTCKFFLKRLFLKKNFPVNLAKFLRTHFMEHFW